MAKLDIDKYSATPEDGRDIKSYSQREGAKEVKDKQIDEVAREPHEEQVKYTIIDGIKVPF